MVKIRLRDNAKYKINGAILRSKTKLMADSFSEITVNNLEKYNGKVKSIKALRVNEKIITDELKLREHKRDFYQKLYTKQKPKASKINFFENLKKLDDEDKDFCEQLISIFEMGEALFKMNNNSSPGSDGFTASFLKFFWKDLKDIVAGSLREGLKKGELAYEQREGLLILLPKKDRDLLEIENYRPISLLNVDYKILTKCLSNRLQKVLNKTIDYEQNGFIKNRNVANTTLSMTSIIDFCWKNNLSCGLLALDLKKAFDMVDREYLIKVLKGMNFGENFISYINCIFKGNFSTIVTNGVRELGFSIERGVRQGDGVSALLFIIALQPLMNTIKNDNRIRGIKIGDKNIKLELLADDTTVYIKDERDAEVVLEIFAEFTKVSGLTINEDKSKILWLGKKPVKRKIGLIKNVDELENLGIIYKHSVEGTLDANYSKLIVKIFNLCDKYKRFNYDFYQKVYILNTYILSKVWYVSRVLYPPKWFIEQARKHIRNFFGGIKDKVKYKCIIAPRDMGGVKLPDIENRIKAQHLMWFKNIFDKNEHNWKILLSETTMGKYKKIAMGTEKCDHFFLNNLIELKNTIKSKVLDRTDILSQVFHYNTQLKIGKNALPRILREYKL